MMFDQGELPVGVDQGIAVHRQVDSGSWLPIGAIDDVLDRAAMVSTATEVRALTANRHPAAAVVDGTRGPRRSAVAHSSHAPRNARTNSSLRRKGQVHHHLENRAERRKDG